MTRLILGVLLTSASLFGIWTPWQKHADEKIQKLAYEAITRDSEAIMIGERDGQRTYAITSLHPSSSIQNITVITDKKKNLLNIMVTNQNNEHRSFNAKDLEYKFNQKIKRLLKAAYY